MPTAIAPSPTWHPETKAERDAVLRELERVLQSPQFSNSKRYPALLRFVVLRALAGDSDTLKERTLGVEVFQRAPTYDTNSDTVVRYTAGEVRKRLFLFYASPHPPFEEECPVQISLPAGSYVPEFTRVSEHRHGLSHPPPAAEPSHEAAFSAPALVSVHEPLAASPVAVAPLAGALPNLWVRTVLLGLAVVLIATLGLLGWRKAHPPDAVEQFWSPVFRQNAQAVVCSGGVVFSQNHFSGTLTAGKDIDYPFVSMQIASAIARVSGELEHGKVISRLQPCTSTPLSELRDHPVILLGGYNNTWTLRLLSTLRFRFTPEPIYAIQDAQHPQRMWARNMTLPYSNSDDYALVARFRDSTTGEVVIVLAGLGRNGTEAAAQFATTPAYMQQVRERLGVNLDARNIEMVLKVNVVDGKTGAPTLQDVYVW